MSVHRGGRGPGHMTRSSGKPGDGGAVAFVPSSLFGGGDIGNAWDTTDLTHVWQSNAGTTGGAFTSPVGRLDDISGKGNHWNATADTALRPTLVNTNNGLLSFTAAQRFMSTASGFFAAGTMTFIAAVKGATQANFIWAEVRSSTSPNSVFAPGLRGRGVGSDMLNYQRNDASTAVANAMAVGLLDGAIHIVVVKTTTTTTSVSVDNGAFVTDTYSRSPPVTLDRTSMGNAFAGGTTDFGQFTGNVGAGIAIGRTLTGTLGTAGTEMTNAYNWVAGKHGLTTL